MFYLLRIVTVTQVTGSFDEKFWNQDVLLAARTSPAVWHAALAFAAMHLRMRLVVSEKAANKPSGREYYTLALVQYNKAIRNLAHLANKPDMSYQDKEIVLLTHILCAGICCLHRNMSGAIINVESAVKFYYQWQFDETAKAQSSSNQHSTMLAPRSLINIVATLQYQLLDLDAQTKDKDKPQLPQITFPIPPALSTPYLSADEAYFELMRISFSIEKIFRGASDPVNPYRDAWHTWQQRFARYRLHHRRRVDAFSMQKPIIDERERARLERETDAINVLELLRASYEVGFEASAMSRIPRKQTGPIWSKFYPIVVAAEQYMARQAKTSEQVQDGDGLMPVFSFTLSICHVLRIIGMVSANLDIRKKIVELLLSCPRRDGFLDGELDAFFIQSKMNFLNASIEEAKKTGFTACDCTSDMYVCTNHRISKFNLDFSTQGLVKLSCWNRELLEAGGTGIIYTMAWQT